MAAAARKKWTTSLSLSMEAFGIEVEEELSTKATQTFAEAWTRQISKVQTWRQVRQELSRVRYVIWAQVATMAHRNF